jgi:hypothetical protein
MNGKETTIKWFIEPRNGAANQCILDMKERAGKGDEFKLEKYAGEDIPVWEVDAKTVSSMFLETKSKNYKFISYIKIDNQPLVIWKPIPAVGTQKVVFVLHKMRGDYERNAKSVLNIIVNESSKRVRLEAPYLGMKEYIETSDLKLRKEGVRLTIKDLFSRRYNEVWIYGERMTEGMIPIFLTAILLNIHIRYMSDEIEASAKKLLGRN